MTTSKLKVLDLYSGIGGFSYGFHNAGGFETAAFCEIDAHCKKVLKKNFGNIPIYHDVGIFTSDDVDKIDVICGGFPCTDVSVAGLQKGLIDDEGKITRSGLWFQYKRIIQEVRPKWVVIENVRNLLNNGFATVLQDLHEIGYDCEWQVISARDVGAPHLRERVWIVAWPSKSKPELFPIPELDGYWIDKGGRVFSTVRGHAKQLKTRIQKGGYEELVIVVDNKKHYHRVHRLMAKTFLKIDDDLQVNHKNFIKTDNRLENLEVVTPKENIAHAIRGGVHVNGRKILESRGDDFGCDIREGFDSTKGEDGGGRVSNSQRKRLEGLVQRRRLNRKVGESEERGRTTEECSDSSLCESSSERDLPDSHLFRFWPTFASEEEKCKWWTEAALELSGGWETESRILRVADGLPKGLEQGRRQRIKQLGNSIIPKIAEIIGKRIMYHEGLL